MYRSVLKIHHIQMTQNSILIKKAYLGRNNYIPIYTHTHTYIYIYIHTHISLSLSIYIYICTTKSKYRDTQIAFNSTTQVRTLSTLSHNKVRSGVLPVQAVVISYHGPLKDLLLHPCTQQATAYLNCIKPYINFRLTHRHTLSHLHAHACANPPSPTPHAMCLQHKSACTHTIITHTDMQSLSYNPPPPPPPPTLMPCKHTSTKTYIIPNISEIHSVTYKGDQHV